MAILAKMHVKHPSPRFLFYVWIPAIIMIFMKQMPYIRNMWVVDVPFLAWNSKFGHIYQTTVHRSYRVFRVEWYKFGMIGFDFITSYTAYFAVFHELIIVDTKFAFFLTLQIISEYRALITTTKVSFKH